MSNYLHLYLHGFASSPNSTKALYFQQRYQEINTPLAIMDFNQPDFTNLSLSRQINQVTKVITEKQESWEGQKIHPQFILIGSSFGGLTASWVAHNNPDKIKALILLAPAFNFALHLKKFTNTRGFYSMAKRRFLFYLPLWLQATNVFKL